MVQLRGDLRDCSLDLQWVQSIVGEFKVSIPVLVNRRMVKIGEMLKARPPKIVNGPEILNKYVGASEENIRALFAEAEAEYEAAGDDSELHIIIMDEIRDD